jgi:hypothetical protein
LEVLGLDLRFAVGEGVEEREADGVCFCAGTQGAGDPGGLDGRELGVGVAPELAGLLV